jgi:hypothetical protein
MGVFVNVGEEVIVSVAVFVGVNVGERVKVGEGPVVAVWLGVIDGGGGRVADVVG